MTSGRFLFFQGIQLVFLVSCFLYLIIACRDCNSLKNFQSVYVGLLDNWVEKGISKRSKTDF